MKQNYKKILMMTGLLLLFQIVAFAQSAITISGTVRDKATKETLPAVTLMIKGKNIGTATDGKGEYTLKTNTPTPFVLVVSYLSYKAQEITVTGAGKIDIDLEPDAVLGQEVVVAASRVEEKILESPVSIERMGAQAIQNTPAPSFYDALANLKGVDMSTQSLTFKSINTRGFAANGNVRFNQFVDGMDNQAPGLNFSVGNVVGLSELDVDNVELIPGASSALYGAGGTNGTLLMTSKSPFKYQGLSYQGKVGMMHVGEEGMSAQPMWEQNIRYAHAFNNKFALKVNASFLQADDWRATNFSDRTNTSSFSHDGNPKYDGINIYGDEVNTTFSGLPNLPGIGANPLNGQTVSRTGYAEQDVANYNTKSYKFSGALHYKITESIEAIIQGNYGLGSSVYTGADRYSLKDFNIGQYKAEVKGANFFVRGYTIRENSGDSYAAGTMASYINEAWKPSQVADNPATPENEAANGWFYQYAQAYGGARAGAVNGVPMDDANAHAYARGIADQGRFSPGSAGFEAAKQAIISRPIGDPQGGAKFVDKTNLYHFEGMYNFSSALKVVDLIVGASYRQYDLNSEGTLFADRNGRKIDVNEYGTYAQISKRFLDDKIKISVAGRYDKMDNFDGKFTPRISGVFTVAKDNNIRISYQTGYRNPTMQDQYIDLFVAGRGRLIGGLPEFRQTYQFDTNPVYTPQSVAAAGATYQQTYIAALQAGQSQAQAQQAAAAAALPVFVKQQFNDFKPEEVKAFEVGYKGLITSKLLIDVSYYNNSFTNFIGSVSVVQSQDPNNPFGTFSASTRNGYSVPINVAGTVKAQGVAAGLDYLIGKFNVGGNITYNKLRDLPDGVDNEFNTPEYKTNIYFGGKNIFKNAGFNVTYRWQDKFHWFSDFAVGDVPAYGTVDAQISYKVPMIKAIFKAGGSNLFNKYYYQAYGNPSVGGLYYVSVTFDQLLK